MNTRTPLRRLAGAVLAGAVLAGAVAATGVLAPQTAAGGEPGETLARNVPLRVVSYNVHAGIGADGRLDLRRTATTLRGLQPDVVGLQEVDVHWSARSEWRDQARRLADALDMRVFFAPIYSLDPPSAGEPRREYGLAVLTRLPILDTQNHRITRLSTQSGDPTPGPAPGFPEVVVSAGGALVHVYATHLDYRADPAVRAMQVDDMLQIMAGDGPAAQQVLVGDFNAPPQADELAPLWEHLVDVWPVAGSGEGLTFPTTAPTKRIDYITVSRGVTPAAAAVPQTNASDHLPVVADLVVRRGG